MGKSGEVALLYVPCGSEEEARNIAATLVQEGLIACGNIVVSRSLYTWQDRLVDETEHILLCKTTQAAALSARSRIEQLHSYDIPCIISVDPASVNAAYARWVSEQVTALNARAVSATTNEVDS
jgi:periplasmic divalent cation tolerance protein